jgi:alcohol dehydrogenase class IV
VELTRALHFRYNSVAQEIGCDTEAISGLGGALDRLGAKTAMIICGPSILRGSQVIQRVQEALAQRYAGLFAGVLPHAPVPTLEEAVTVARSLQPEALVSVGGGSTHDTANGTANAILLPHTMRFNLAASAERQALIAQAMGLNTAGMSPSAAGLAAAEAVAQLCHHLGLPARLRDVDVPPEGLEAIAAATLHDRALATNPQPIGDAEPILHVLCAAW